MYKNLIFTLFYKSLLIFHQNSFLITLQCQIKCDNNNFYNFIFGLMLANRFLPKRVSAHFTLCWYLPFCIIFNQIKFYICVKIVFVPLPYSIVVACDSVRPEFQHVSVLLAPTRPKTFRLKIR